jgi:hypothetical protein
MMLKRRMRKPVENGTVHASKGGTLPLTGLTIDTRNCAEYLTSASLESVLAACCSACSCSGSWRFPEFAEEEATESASTRDMRSSSSAGGIGPENVEETRKLELILLQIGFVNDVCMHLMIVNKPMRPDAQKVDTSRLTTQTDSC